MPVILMIVYFWWMICTPYVRFPVLGDIYFERLVAAAWLISILMESKKPSLRSPFATLLVLQFLLLLVLSWITWIPPQKMSIHWQQNYWKKVLFFFLAVLSIRDRKDLYHTVGGIVAIVYAYQVVSWRDFLSGGSYVYQQGLVRMTGIWVSNSFGAANYWGSLSAFMAPFVLYIYRRAAHPWMRYALLPLMLLLVLSVIYSGSRGSLVAMVAFIAFALRSKLWRPHFIIAGIVIVAVTLTVLPDQYKQRYSMIFVTKSDVYSGTREEQRAKKSAASRLQGLVDGWKILLKHPQGTGPGSSHIARFEVNKELAAGGKYFQTHNLYGQVIAESGVLGSILFFLLWYRMYRFLGERGEPESLDVEKEAVLGGMFVMLVYGMASHSLYTDWWIWLYVFCACLLNIGRGDMQRAVAAAPPRTSQIT